MTKIYPFSLPFGLSELKSLSENLLYGPSASERIAGKTREAAESAAIRRYSGTPHAVRAAARSPIEIFG
jgi:hypothetical protein